MKESLMFVVYLFLQNLSDRILHGTKIRGPGGTVVKNTDLTIQVSRVQIPPETVGPLI